MLGDAHFREGDAGSYILAVAEYKEFLSLYPSHPKADYAQFMAGEVVLQAEELVRQGPDDDTPGPRGVPATPRRLPRIAPTSSRPESASETTRQTLGQARVPGRVLLSANAQGLSCCRPAVPGPARRLPGLRTPRRGPFSPWRGYVGCRTRARGPPPSRSTHDASFPKAPTSSQPANSSHRYVCQARDPVKRPLPRPRPCSGRPPRARRPQSLAGPQVKLETKRKNLLTVPPFPCYFPSNRVWRCRAMDAHGSGSGQRSISGSVQEGRQ